MPGGSRPAAPAGEAKWHREAESPPGAAQRQAQAGHASACRGTEDSGDVQRAACHEGPGRPPQEEATAPGRGGERGPGGARPGGRGGGASRLCLGVVTGLDRGVVHVR